MASFSSILAAALKAVALLDSTGKAPTLTLTVDNGFDAAGNVVTGNTLLGTGALANTATGTAEDPIRVNPGYLNKLKLTASGNPTNQLTLTYPDGTTQIIPLNVATGGLTKLATPTLTAVAASATSVTLTSSAVANAAGYAYQRATDAAFTQGVTTVAGTGTTTTDTGLTAGTYYYRNRASGSGNNADSDYSAVVSVVVSAAVPAGLLTLSNLTLISSPERGFQGVAGANIASPSQIGLGDYYLPANKADYIGFAFHTPNGKQNFGFSDDTALDLTHMLIALGPDENGILVWYINGTASTKAVLAADGSNVVVAEGSRGRIYRDINGVFSGKYAADGVTYVDLTNCYASNTLVALYVKGAVEGNATIFNPKYGTTNFIAR